MRNSNVAETILFSVLFLFFLQSLSDFIEAIYAFGLLVTAFTVEVTSIILFFTPLLLLAFRRAPSRAFLLGLAGVAAAARLVAPMLAPGGKLVACGISVGAFMLLFPLLLQRRARVHGGQAGRGLLIATSLSILFRTANSSLDVSQSGIFQGVSWLLGIAALILLGSADLSAAEEFPAERKPAAGRVTGLAIGLASILLMIYFVFASPAVIARWTGFSYPAIVITLVTALAVFAYLLSSEHFSVWLTRRAVLGWNVLFVALLVLTILPHQIAFPSSPEAYPLAAPAASPLAAIFLFLMLVLSPIIFIDFILLLREISWERPSLPQLGGSFAGAALFFLLLVFFHVFTTIYDYAPVIGPFFRDRFWFVHLLVGLGVGLPLLLVRRGAFALGKPENASPFTFFALGTLALLSALALYLTAAEPVPPQSGAPLKIMTFNIQQGFDQAGNKNLEAQLAAIRAVDPDLLGLQESDTARVANGNDDAVRYFADQLDMYSYYGPTTTAGTFGIALLSKYPIQDPTTFFMYSPGEQTATIQAMITTEDGSYQVFVTHLGNDGPIFQLEDMLRRVQGLENVIAMGDFNFRPATEQYALMTRTLEDAWLLKWPTGKEIPGFSEERRIDHIFVSPGLRVLEAEYAVTPASDHPYQYITIEP